MRPTTRTVSLRKKGTYVAGKKHGPWEDYSYHENGQLKEKYTRVAGEEDGPYESRLINGHLWERGSYNRGQKCGLWKEPGWFGRTRTKTYPPC